MDVNYQPSRAEEGTFTPDDLITGEFPYVTEQVTILSGQNIKRGALLGKITASGKHILSLAAAGDGSQTPDMILAEDVDATGGDKVSLAYKSGGFNTNRITFGTGHTAASVEAGLRDKGIYFKAGVPA